MVDLDPSLCASAPALGQGGASIPQVSPFFQPQEHSRSTAGSRDGGQGEGGSVHAASESPDGVGEKGTLTPRSTGGRFLRPLLAQLGLPPSPKALRWGDVEGTDQGSGCMAQRVASAPPSAGLSPAGRAFPPPKPASD